MSYFSELDGITDDTLDQIVTLICQRLMLSCEDSDKITTELTAIIREAVIRAAIVSRRGQ